jgi:hypothetical protein
MQILHMVWSLHVNISWGYPTNIFFLFSHDWHNGSVQRKEGVVGMARFAHILDIGFPFNSEVVNGLHSHNKQFGHLKTVHPSQNPWG